ncbi:acyl-CoA dehydrogenase family protein [Desulforhopalus singaporensis]|uniref:Acyl-CoA dehydrogenase n=1 Tax=Desulforhopalus singaporensis TaxID=91360 RepID=A0A1H0SRE8_9BACT|nr:acyl-CoA dehydrogenase family protein [Desulforhopalus singaporensis]SDP44327.1 Acyl-CoA dehydrogenase [Desulforhopalus singaporensis]
MADKEIVKGGHYLIAETSCADVFTPEDFTDEHRQMGDTVAQFIENEIIPNTDEIEKQQFEHTYSGMEKCGELGMLMMEATEEDGGLDLDLVSAMLTNEKVSHGGSFAATYTAHTGIGTLPLIYYGNADQKERYLGKLMSGEWIGAYCLTEPGSGSDALGAQASAVLSEDGKHYILNGTKQFITNGGIAGLYTIFAKIDREHFTGFLVERDTEGLIVGPEEKKLGIKGSSTTQIILDNCKVPVENLLGEKGKGHKIAFNVLNIGRLKLGASTLGGSKKALKEGIKYANERKQFNTPISRFGAIGEKIADLTAHIFASESVVYRAAGIIDDRLARVEKTSANYYDEYLVGIEEYAVECAIPKVFCSDVLARVVDEVVQIHGGYGFVQDYPAERFYRDERINRIFEGTNEINRLIIPGMILRKAMKGEMPIQAEAMKAFEALMTPGFDEIDDTVLFGREKALVKNLKTLFLILAGAGVRKFMDKLANEQEILIASANLAIQIYALESTVLRAEKIHAGLSDRMQEVLTSAVKIFAFDAAEAAATAAKKGAFFVEEGDNLAMILSGVRRFTKYDASGLLGAKKTLAAAACEGEKYIFN